MWAAGKGSLIVFCQQIPLRRLSADQHRCNHLVYRFADRCVFAVFMFFNLLHQKFHRFSSEHIDLLSYGADREDGVSGGGGVVEADDQVVFREFTVFSYQQIDQDAGVGIVGDENALFPAGRVRLDLGENLFQMLLGSCLIFHLMEKDAVWNLLFPAKIFKPFDSTVCRDTFGGRIVDVEKHFTVVTIEQTGRLDRTHVVIGVDAADVSILPLDRYDRDMQVGKFHRRDRMA